MTIFGNKSFGEASEEDIQRLIDNHQTESIILEFKQELGKDTKEIAKDISAMANSEGGIIIYGLIEDETGAAKSINWLNAQDKIPEKIEEVISATITPRVYVKIFDQISSKEDPSKKIFVVYIPRSNGLHMVIKGKDNRYYKRIGRTVQSMEHSEIMERLHKQAQKQDNIRTTIRELDVAFNEHSLFNMDGYDKINYYLVPSEYIGLTDSDTLFTNIAKWGTRRPIIGVPSKCYKGSVGISNVPFQIIEYWLQLLIIHRDFVMELRRNFNKPAPSPSGSIIKRKFYTVSEFAFLAFFAYWGADFLRKYNYHGGFHIVASLSGITDFALSKTMGTTNGIHLAKNADILESIEFDDILSLTEEEIKEKVLVLIKLLSSYAGVTGNGNFVEIIEESKKFDIDELYNRHCI